MAERKCTSLHSDGKDVRDYAFRTRCGVLAEVLGVSALMRRTRGRRGARWEACIFGKVLSIKSDLLFNESCMLNFELAN